MADPRINFRRSSHSYSHSEASDADSSSTSIREANPDTSAQHAPIVRSEPAASLTPVVTSANAIHPPVHGMPVHDRFILQQPSAPATSKAEPPEWQWEALTATLTLNKVFLFNEEVQTLLADYSDAKHIVVQPRLVMDNAVGVINLLGAATNVTSIHFSRLENVNDGGYHDAPYLNSDSAIALAALAKKHPALTKLSFQNLPFVKEDFFSKFGTVMKDNLTIEVLEILNCGYGLGYTMTSPLGDDIAAFLAHAKGIKTVTAPQNLIYDSGAKAIGATLAKNKSLITLDLGHDEIGSDGAKAIFDGLRKNKKTALSKLDLSGSVTDARSARSLGKLLKQNTSLKVIVVGHVTDPEAAQYISKGLSANKSGCIVRYG